MSRHPVKVSYEYIRLVLDFGDLSELNQLGSAGWRVVSVVDDVQSLCALLERKLED